MNKVLFFILTVCGICGGLLNPLDSFAEELIKADKALQQIFPKGVPQKETRTLSSAEIAEVEKNAKVDFQGSHLSEIIFYKVYENNALLGYAYEDTVIGKWGPIHYLIGLDPQGRILKTIILDYQEIRGKPIAKKRFLNQYQGKDLSHLRFGKDIDGITGATISSRSLTDGIRKLLYIHSLIQP